jgi:MinD superfamily P-loop ATPase
MTTVYKRCPECKKWHEARKFYKDSTTPDGLMSWCKSCMNCDIVRDRPAYGNGERQFGDPTEEQIAAECRLFQAKWSDKVRHRRKNARVPA